MKSLLSTGLWSFVALAAVTILWDSKKMGWWEYVIDNTLLLHLLWNGVGIALLVGAMGRNRSISYSINTVESLRWSLGNAWQGALLGLLGGLVVGCVLPFISSLGDRWWIPFLGFAIVGLGIGGILGGLKPHVLQTKTVPNQGIRLSLRMASLVALNALWLVAIVVGIAWEGDFVYHPAFRVGDYYVPGLGHFTATVTTLFLWFGGLDVIKHYVLRAVLNGSGQTPWNLVRFLEQARSLNLMQRAGSAYIFAHRRLLEHLAAPGQAR
ncbi:MAG: hypothetical protein OEV38_11965 [Nitrospira sp.]|nr:hypothetical protein [Nitrospira sp.]MDH5320491.1 hypothetical protein [Nitrospira sp.]